MSCVLACCAEQLLALDTLADAEAEASANQATVLHILTNALQQTQSLGELKDDPGPDDPNTSTDCNSVIIAAKSVANKANNALQIIDRAITAARFERNRLSMDFDRSAALQAKRSSSSSTSSSSSSSHVAQVLQALEACIDALDGHIATVVSRRTDLDGVLHVCQTRADVWTAKKRELLAQEMFSEEQLAQAEMGEEEENDEEENDEEDEGEELITRRTGAAETELRAEPSRAEPVDP